jgi:hypothetical protein
MIVQIIVTKNNNTMSIPTVGSRVGEQFPKNGRQNLGGLIPNNKIIGMDKRTIKVYGTPVKASAQKVPP